MSIYGKLSAIQTNLIAPKGQHNDFGKYNYRSCEDILKALKPLCDANSCVTYISNDIEEIGGRVYVKAVVTLHDLETGESITSVAHAREEESKKGMDGSQVTGASSSYARKYALAGLFCIDNEKDSDATNEAKTEVKTEPKAQAKPATKEQPKAEVKKPSAQDVQYANLKAKVLKYINKHLSAESMDKVCKHFGINSVNEMDMDMCQRYIVSITKQGGNIDE